MARSQVSFFVEIKGRYVIVNQDRLFFVIFKMYIHLQTYYISKPHPLPKLLTADILRPFLRLLPPKLNLQSIDDCVCKIHALTMRCSEK